MARVTVEDCIDKVESPYELVLVAKERATQLNSGIEPTLKRDKDKKRIYNKIIATEKKKPTLSLSLSSPSLSSLSFFSFFYMFLLICL